MKGKDELYERIGQGQRLNVWMSGYRVGGRGMERWTNRWIDIKVDR